MRVVPLILVLSLWASAAAFAQDQPDPFSTARMRIGPLAVTPAIGLTNFGIDTNVFNQVQNPKKDFTLTVTPRAQTWLRMGRGRLGASALLDLVYYQQYSSERSVNLGSDVSFELPLRRFKPFASDRFTNTRERPGYEIDVRARHIENMLTAGANVKLGAKTDVELSGYRTRVKFDADETFQGSYLSEVLNRNENGLRATVRYHITPLTTFLIGGEAQKTRFEFSPVRDADSVRIAPGVELAPFALISGSAVIGFRKYDTLGSGVPDYSGLVAAVNLGYTLLGRTRFSAQADRDIEYSFEPAEPYYLLTGFAGTVTHQVAAAWDVQGTAGRQRLDYRRVGTTPAGQERIDFVTTYGGGVGYRLGRDARLGFHIDHYRRTSDRLTRDYTGLQFGVSMTYGM